MFEGLNLNASGRRGFGGVIGATLTDVMVKPDCAGAIRPCIDFIAVYDPSHRKIAALYPALKATS